MELSLFLSMLGFLWVAAITPGPNNMLLTASGANFGFFRTLPLMVGIMIGMQLMLLMVAFGVGGAILLYPSLHLILKVAGSLYLLWLAWKIATAAYEKLETDAAPVAPMPFWQGGLLQLINPKAWLMALGGDSQLQPGRCRISPLCNVNQRRDGHGQSGRGHHLDGVWRNDWPCFTQSARVEDI